MKELDIPVEHFDKFKFFIGLPIELKSKLLEFLKDVPIGITPTKLTDLCSKSLTKLSRERIEDLLSIYFNLSRTRDSLEIGLDEFIEALSVALENTGLEELKPTGSILEDFRNLLSQSNNASITINAIDLMIENQKTFLSSSVIQDIRPVFDQDNYIGNVLIHNLKIRFKENDNSKELFIALDDNDLEKLISSLKKSQERSKLIKEKISNTSIIEIK